MVDDSCPVCATADIICGKWTILVIRDLAESRSRFCELERSLAGISPRTLSVRLRGLEEQGIVGPPHLPRGAPSRGVQPHRQGTGSGAADRRHAQLRQRVARRQRERVPAGRPSRPPPPLSGAAPSGGPARIAASGAAVGQAPWPRCSRRVASGGSREADRRPWRLHPAAFSRAAGRNPGAGGESGPHAQPCPPRRAARLRARGRRLPHRRWCATGPSSSST